MKLVKSIKNKKKQLNSSINYKYAKQDNAVLDQMVNKFFDVDNINLFQLYSIIVIYIFAVLESFIFYILQNMIKNSYQNKENINSQTPLPLLKSQVFDDSFIPNLNANLQIQSLNQELQHIDQQNLSSRHQQHTFMYFINLLISFCLSFQNVVLVFTTDEDKKGYMSITIMLCTIVVSVITTLSLTSNKWKIINLYMLLDNIFLVEVASAFGFIGFVMVIYTPGNLMQLITMIAFPVQIIFFVGNFRIMMFHVQWAKWKVILFKLVLLADAVAFFEIGAYYMSKNHLYTNGEDTELDGKVKDFVLLYIFGMFTLFCELYSKMCDIDQTSQLKYSYQLKELCEQKRMMKIRKSMIATKNQVTKQKSRFCDKNKNRQIVMAQIINQNCSQ